jgi:methylated-DNA-[protein]-cysteine S-methyltransferase
MTCYVSTFMTPLGAFSLALNPSGAVAATAFGPPAGLRARLGARRLAPDSRIARHAREQILEYFAGGRRHFDFPLAPAGTAFQQRVWMALRRIPFGTTRSYGALARELRTSPRAVGRANATNPVCLIVPCHRVVGTDGSLTGFAFGERIKASLLDHEAAVGAGRRIAATAT